MTMTFEELKGFLKQRFPLIMVDKVLEIEPDRKIRAIKNVTGNEIYFLGHFPEHAIMPGVLIIEAIGQCASILFSSTGGKAMAPGEALVLGAIHNMRFLAPVSPGDTIVIEVNVLKMVEEAVLVEGMALVDGNVVVKGELGFARRVL